MRHGGCLVSRTLEKTHRAMSHDWGTAVVVDPLELQRLKDDCARLRVVCRWRSVSTWGLLVASVGLAAVACSQLWHATKLYRDLRDGRRSAQRSSRALAAMAHSHERILSATEQTPLFGTKSWGRRFKVTNYIPRSPKYGKFNDGLTATLTRAEPSARIVAVDPALIPYGSWVWIEGLGWYRAEDCGGAIKGFRLDLLVATEKEAMQFGKQERFVIVVPPGPKPASDLTAAGPEALRIAHGGA
jgi:3D (Asp-Asp-Asp) domain-containing protein